MNFEEPDGVTPLEHEEKEGLKFKHITTRSQLDELEQANISSEFCGYQETNQPIY